MDVVVPAAVGSFLILLEAAKPRQYGIMDMRLRLYFDRLGDMAVPVPPRGEQTRILELVRTETSQLDRIHQATDRTIALLKERRAALIAAAVTGRIKPREVITNARDE